MGCSYQKKKKNPMSFAYPVIDSLANPLNAEEKINILNIKP